ncbi:unnamed protein product [Symbiodinium sp. CCMP2456]|nr:unnamed protein product [Symbiodinium sp. CCMP2456]
MGCGSSMQVNSFDELEMQVHMGKVVEKRVVGYKPTANLTTLRSSQVSTQESCYILPHATEGVDSSLSGPISDSEADTPDTKDCDSVTVHVPPRLRGIIKEEPVLLEFNEPSQVESSWNMPSVRERAKDLPSGIIVAPDQELHKRHLKNLDRFRSSVFKAPSWLEDEVAARRKLSGMGSLPRK